MSVQSYAAALEHLSQLAVFGMQPGTERLATVLHRLGDPQQRFVALHIAGTNGKGSTAAFSAQLLLCAARLEAPAGHRRRIGLYTSPHLLRVRERIQLSDRAGAALQPCSEEDFAEAIAAVQDAAASEPAVTLTFFEVLTAAAFRLFAAHGVEVAVIETGLGGRLDATRLCAAAVTVISSIGWDHAEVLGPTLADIAREKAGIFRPGVPALAACADPGARAVLITEARRVGAPLWLHADYAEPGVPELPALASEQRPHVALPGAHQLRNAALAIGAVAQLPGPLAPLLRRPDVVAAALAQARWPGRLERITPKVPLPRLGPDAPMHTDGTPGAWPDIWLDAAHNPEGAEALDRWLVGALAGRPLTVLFGAVAGKDLSGMVAPLHRARAVVLTTPPSPRGLPVAELRARVEPSLAAGPAAPTLASESEPAAALACALAATGPGGMLLVYGSIFLIAAVRGLLLGEQGDPFRIQDPLKPAPPPTPR